MVEDLFRRLEKNVGINERAATEAGANDDVQVVEASYVE